MIGYSAKTPTDDKPFPTDGSAREAAKHYVSLGLAPIPVPYRSKGCVIPDWQSLRIQAHQIEDHFDHRQNIGVLNGLPSGNLADVDLDCPEAIAAAHFLLPPTGWKFGRPSRRRSHWVYCSFPCIDTASQGFRDLDGSMLVELRGTGGQTIYPPSVHEDTGESVEWDEFGKLADVPSNFLGERVGEVAAVAILARHWTVKGSRQDAYMALAGGILRAGCDIARAKRVVAAIAEVTKDEEKSKRLAACDQTSKKLKNDEPATGFTRLSELLGERGKELVSRVCDFLQLNSENSEYSAHGEAWPAPILLSDVPDVPEFPVECLPAWMADYCVDVAIALQVPVDLNAMLVLAFAAAAFARKVVVEIRDGWTEPLNIFCVVALPPGERKSAAFAKAMRPVAKFEAELIEKAAPAIAEAETRLRQQQAKLSYLEKQLAKEQDAANAEAMREQAADLAREISNAIMPVQPVLIVDDETPESLDKTLAAQGGRLLIAAPEGTIFEIVKGRYSDKPIFDVFLKAHAGDTLRTGRVTRGRNSVERAALTTALAVQPDVIQGLAEDASMKGRGFLGRFLYSLPKSSVGHREIAAPAASAAVVALYERSMRALWNCDYSSASEETDAPHILRFSPESDEVLQAFERQLEPKLSPDGEYASMGGWANKLSGAVARIAGILHLCKHAEEGFAVHVPIAADTVRDAARIGFGYLLPHARAAFFTMGLNENVANARHLLKWLLREKVERFQKRDLHQSNRARFKLVDDLDPVIALMERHYLIRPLPTKDRGGRGRKPSPCYEVNPQLLGSQKTQNTQKSQVGGREARPKESADVGGTAEPRSQKSQNTQNPPNADEEDGPNFALALDKDGLRIAMEAVSAASEVALDIETTGLDPDSDRIRLLSVAVARENAPPAVHLVDVSVVDPAPLLEVLRTKNLLIHNAAFDLGFLARLGFTPSGNVCDTMIREQVLVAGTNESASLEACCQRRLRRSLDKTEQKSDWTGKLNRSQLTYAAIDVQVLFPLKATQQAEIERARLSEVVAVEEACVPTLIWLARSGVSVDAEQWKTIGEQALADAATLRGKLNAAATPSAVGLFGPQEWNWDSNVQSLKALNASGCELCSTDEDALAAADHPLARLLMEYRTARKRCGAFGTNWLKHLGRDGRVRCQWRQVGAASGRMSCSSPNLQQIPRGDYRTCIKAPPGRVLVKADYSQIELRIAAKITGDEALLEAYQRGDDLHVVIAQRVLGVETVAKADRQLAKALNFGLLYGMGAKGFMKYAMTQYGLAMSMEEAARYRDGFFEAYPGLRRWHELVRLRKARETRTLAGRRRILPAEISDTLRLNTPVQGTGADGLKQALAILWSRREEIGGAFPVLVVHDEIVLEAAQTDCERVGAWLKAVMVEGMKPLIDPVPVEVEVSIGASWGQ
jgi:DNA polymerase-1